MSEIILSFDVTSINVSKDSSIQMFCYVIKKTKDDEASAILYKCPLDERTSITIEDIDSAEYIIKIKMDGKIKMDDGIISSAKVMLDDFKFNDSNITGYIEDNATYTHDFNGNGKETAEQFNKTLGYNGTVGFNFTTPLDLWLLENMD